MRNGDCWLLIVEEGGLAGSSLQAGKNALAVFGGTSLRVREAQNGPSLSLCNEGRRPRIS